MMGVIFFSRGFTPWNLQFEFLYQLLFNYSMEFIPLNNQFVFVCEIGIKPFHGMNPVE